MLLVRANHPHHTLAADDLALVTNLLHRRSNLHTVLLPCRSARSHYGDDAAARQIPRRELHANAVADEHPDKIPSGPAGRVRHYLALMLDPDAIQPVRQ